MKVSLEKVPVADRRRAAEMLESLLSMPDENGNLLTGAHLGQHVTPMYRPDLDEIAYWEFTVEGIHTGPTVAGTAPGGHDRGFIVTATGAHDVPLPHFSLDMAPPSERLERLGQGVSRIIKLDSLCYVAEGEDGQLIGQIGSTPIRLEGVPDELREGTSDGWATTFDPDERREGGEDGDVAQPAELRTSPAQRAPTPRAWKSWAEVKEKYASVYAPQLAALAKRAAHPWKVDGLIQEFGEGIESGETFPLPMLERSEFSVSGSGADFVHVELDAKRVPPRLLLTPRSTGESSDLTFQVTFHYSFGDEVLTFCIVPTGTPITDHSKESPLGPTFEG